MRILITGGAGFIGSHLAELFQGRASVRIIDNFRTGRRENLQGLDTEFIQGSILDRSLIHEAVKDVDYVYHLAAMVSVPESLSQPQECVDINVIGLLNVLEESAKARVRKLCFCSSAAVYGNNPSSPKREDMLPEPRSPYAVTKLDGEYYCNQFAETGRLETVALRFFNVFGPRQDPNGAYAAAVAIFFQRALAGKPITIFGDGGQTRDFISVKDIVAALEFGATKTGLTGVYNVGYGEQLTVLDLAQRIIALTESKSHIQYASERAGDVRHSRANIERLRAAGFQPKGCLQSGLQAMLDFYRSV
ncbi:MAG TPA: NAD-dependent epimerase/dehydratase family protein [Lacunisphaera sp.]|jgi:UDP-glucose 4-epimerase